MLAELAGLSVDATEAELKALAADGLATFREARALWQLTPDGRAAHGHLLEADAGRAGFRAGLGQSYGAFLELNEGFKALCGDWQLRNGAPNDHSDASYDAAVIARLGAIDDAAQPLSTAMGIVASRFQVYAPRLAATRRLVEVGEAKMFTGVMCGSYHDVWMELHEDLILTQGIDRAKEGSF